MIHMVTKVESKYDKTSFLIKINHMESKGKTRLILYWMLLWGICGLIVLSQFFSNHSSQVKLALGIWMVFWTYFLIKALILYSWKTGAFEELSGNKDQWVYSRFNGKKIHRKELEVNQIKKITLSDFNGFAGKWNSGWASFLTPGIPCIQLHVGNENIAIAFQISEDEAKKIAGIIGKFSGLNPR